MDGPMTEYANKGTQIRFFNSMTRRIEVFKPICDDQTRIYSCGPTVYNYAHIGNLRAYVFTDTLRRFLNWKGQTVTHVINITDVGHLTSDEDAGEDKMELASQSMEKDIWQIAEYFTQAFKSDLSQLNVLRPTLWSTATDHIHDMIAFARVLEDSGVTYELATGLYFDTTKVPNYGSLALTPREGQEEGARVDPIAGKRNATDFAIWRRSPSEGKRQMEWLSPWGPGAPGWHLECSVMSMKYLGSRFDIHTGGIDHREIHHCNEIAQNQAYAGHAHSGANGWMHNNFLIDRSGKMSKSKGDFSTLSSLIARGIHPLAFRLMCLSTHYRSELEFSIETLAGQLVRLKRLVGAISSLSQQVESDSWMRIPAELGFSSGAAFTYPRTVLEQKLSPHGEKLLDGFDREMSEDLMTPRALPFLDETINHGQLCAEEKLRILASMDLVFGLKLFETRRCDLALRPKDASLSASEVEVLLEQRQQSRRAKDFSNADAIRNRLHAAGIEMMDGQEPSWEWRPLLR
ncbi:MAG: cysteine--tRNA ligase [Nitrospirae bacterium]|nr:cysteine--tRNA ligase [Magnetococcales bacterium]HAT48719.1 cysteine--tRNA ligase [Alphaproteobacteria bacterium]